MVDPALQRDIALRIGATTVTFDEASHAGGYTHYATRLVKLVEEQADIGGDHDASMELILIRYLDAVCGNPGSR